MNEFCSNVGYKKLLLTGIVRDIAVLTAVGIDQQGNRPILGKSVEVKEAELHWKEFLESLVRRGLRGVEYIVSDAPPRLKAARNGNSRWKPLCVMDTSLVSPIFSADYFNYQFKGNNLSPSPI